MKKLWKYIHFSEITNSITEGQAIKEPFVWSETQPGSDYDDVTTTEHIIEKIKSDYTKFEVDGKKYFEEIRAGLVLLFKSGQKTSADIFGIELMLEKTISKITRGDWMTALNELDQVVVSSPLDQSLYDEIHAHISNYILTNY